MWGTRGGGRGGVSSRRGLILLLLSCWLRPLAHPCIDIRCPAARDPALELPPVPPAPRERDVLRGSHRRRQGTRRAWDGPFVFVGGRGAFHFVPGLGDACSRAVHGFAMGGTGRVQVTDKVEFKEDFIHLPHHSGVSLFEDFLAVTSIHNQLITLFHITVRPREPGQREGVWISMGGCVGMGC